MRGTVCIRTWCLTLRVYTFGILFMELLLTRKLKLGGLRGGQSETSKARAGRSVDQLLRVRVSFSIAVRFPCYRNQR